MSTSIQNLQCSDLRAFLNELDSDGLIRGGTYKHIVVWDYTIPALVSRLKLDSDCVVETIELMKQETTLSIDHDKFENAESYLASLVQMNLLTNTQPMVFEIQPELVDLLSENC